MTYLNALEDELAAAGIPATRRRRIVAEFSDHLHEDADARLGAPRDLARQFADELGTRLARTAAYRVFAALAFVGIAIVAMFAAVGRMRGFTALGQPPHTPTPGWAAPIMMIAALAAQVALAAGGLALLRAWRLRRSPVISAADATMLRRRAALGLLSGAVALAVLPTCAVAFSRQAGPPWATGAWIVTGIGLLALAAAVPALAGGARLTPQLEGRSGDLVDDLGSRVPAWLTPLRFALLLAAAIVIVGGLQGLITSDPYDGLARGLADAMACLAGFAVLGRYLGLRTAG